ncbi:LOW QUALITY PROTEIN: hypothetical protein SORBI_3004G166800 [Sorghum bicolor]|uniref:40S ribosomal protein S14 n=1 Tax=Sorghum bicolor TaxID=4558 RepID=A0A1Z5RN92_SORBI|nr:LOW QUALITY PROTEIN: hypothetical protein SORBI_3004G166800 [Sorghum bicolor]
MGMVASDMSKCKLGYNDQCMTCSAMEVGGGRRRGAQSRRKKTREPKEENVTLDPAVRRAAEHVFGVAHIFASFNDTFIHVTDLSGRETLVPSSLDVAQRCKELGITALHIKLCATGGNKTKTPGPGCYSIQSPLTATRRKGGRRGRRLQLQVSWRPVRCSGSSLSASNILLLRKFFVLY